MLGLANYDSDSDSESTPKQPSPPPKPAKKAPKKIIGLPSLPTDDKDDEEEQPPAKKVKLNTGGSTKSSLFSMLPAPKKASSASEAPQRVLGGGQGPGLAFKTPATNPVPPAETEETEEEASSSSTHLVPISVKRGRPNVSLEEGTSKVAKPTPKPTPTPAIDFFSLGSTSTSKPAPKPTTLALPSLSSAPEVPTFEIPEPKPDDPYPGYYQLPTGAWEAYDPEYYNKFCTKWQKEYDDYVRKLEKGAIRGFEDMDESSMAEIDAEKEREKARVEVQEREARKAVTSSVLQATTPTIKLTEAKRSGIARARHQLATMLNEAFTNREALEAKIAEGKRNRKEAGNKYGF